MMSAFRHVILWAFAMAFAVVPSALADTREADQPVAVFTGLLASELDGPMVSVFEDRSDGKRVVSQRFRTGHPALTLALHVEPSELRPASLYRAAAYGAAASLPARPQRETSGPALASTGGQFAGVFDDAVADTASGKRSGDWRAASSWEVAPSQNRPPEGHGPTPLSDSPHDAVLLQASAGQAVPRQDVKRGTKPPKLEAASRSVNVAAAAEQTAPLVLASLRQGVGAGSPDIRQASRPRSHDAERHKLSLTARSWPTPSSASNGDLSVGVFVDEDGNGTHEPHELDIAIDRLGLTSARANRRGHGVGGELSLAVLREGMFDISVERETLPLGYGVSGSCCKAVNLTRGSAEVLAIPLELVGQVRGAVFIDMDEDGQPGPGDQWIECEAVQLIGAEGDETLSTTSTSFGQYAFDGLPAGAYTLRVQFGWQEARVRTRVTPGEPLQAVPLALSPTLFETTAQRAVVARIGQVGRPAP